ncbi:hypothetical protein KSF_039750 [Reticulibacter mediterranei]|uniref:Uncharacterized protein n=1 Tax=Reticulibacter mediterranei TaxID=2778369 RepID=A0A8J3IMM4_9CHLR|nr:hypothetical protein KSF_039750 [Reticulibacter mediterranei]
MGLFDAIRKFLNDERAESDISRHFWEQVTNGEIEFDPETMCSVCGYSLCDDCFGCLRAECETHCTCHREE